MRLIDADELEKVYSSVVTKGKYPHEHFINAIRESPTVMYEGEKHHARWLDARYGGKHHDKVCSACNWGFPVSRMRKKDHGFAFCPNCGADMDG